ncbi:MAG: PQQ-binding-like beta-propeller repeat protein [Polyangiales bacterium]
MDRRRIVLVALWSAAFVAVVALQGPKWLARPHAPAVREARGPVHTARDRATSGARASAPQAAVAEGPPSVFRGDRRHTGRSPFVGPVAPRVRFRYATGARISAQAVVGRDGRIVVASHDHFLHVLSADGSRLFRADLGAPSYATPYVDPEGRVYAGSDARLLVALEPDGRERYRLETSGELDTGIVPGPDGTLHFAAGRELWAVFPDGRVKYRYRAEGKIYTTPAIADDGTAYVGAQDDRLHAVTPEGLLRFAYATRGDVDASPAIADDGSIVFGSDDRHLHRVDARGALVWSIDLGGMIRAPVALGRDGTVFVSVFGPRTRVVALALEDGRIRWEFELGQAHSADVGVASGVLVDRDGNLYVGAHDDYVYALTPDGRLRFAYETSGDVDASPTLAPDGTLLVGGEDGYLHALR